VRTLSLQHSGDVPIAMHKGKSSLSYPSFQDHEGKIEFLAGLGCCTVSNDKLVTDVLGQPVSHIFKGQAIQEEC
jgi:hypothetical protein